VPVLGVDINAIGADTLWLAAIIAFAFLSPCNQITTFVVVISANSVQKWKSILNRDIDSPQVEALRGYGVKFNCCPCLAAHNRPDPALHQAHKPIREAPRIAMEENSLLTIQLTVSQGLLPLVLLEARKACPSCDQSIDGCQIPLQIA
jgi:hypothetical protein